MSRRSTLFGRDQSHAPRPRGAPSLARLSQDFIDQQDELSVLDFMRKYGMPERINDEIFIAMGKVTHSHCPVTAVISAGS